MSKRPKLVLIDGMALAYRGFFALIRNPIMTTNRFNTSAIYVFANVVFDILVSESPDAVAVVFDTPEPTHRHKAFADYKATRDRMPEELSLSLPFLDRLCAGLRIPVLRYPGWEADDVIGTFVKVAGSSGYETVMVTPDKDYAQLVTESATIARPAKGGGLEGLDVSEVCKEWEIERPEQSIDILALMGDASDNVPGVPGIGKKTAQKLIGAYGSVEALYENIEELKGKQREVLESNREQAFLSKDLVTVVTDVPIEHTLEQLARTEWDKPALTELFRELEFQTLGERVLGESFGTAEAAPQTPMKNVRNVQHTYLAVETPGQIESLLAQLEESTIVCFDIETTGLDEKTAEMVGIAFSFEAHTGYFVSFDDEYGDLLERFRSFFESETTTKIGHNLKYDMLCLRWHGIRVAGPVRDTMIAAFLCTPESRRTMDSLAEDLLGYSPVPIEKLIGEKGKDQISMKAVERDELVEYAAEDADITLQLWRELEALVEERGQHRVFYDIECPLVAVLVEMEYAGIMVDTDALAELAVSLGSDIERIGAEIEKLAGESFNLNSPKQLGEMLFDRLNLEPKPKRTKKSGQYITNEQILSRLAGRYEIAQRILDYRTSSKLKSTYVDMLPEVIFDRTERVHTTYEQAVTATGRLQSHDPNLQNIPVRSDQGREIRKAFVMRNDEFLLLAADYSQIELRIAASLSGEEAMIEAFKSELDIHTSTAMRVFGVDEELVTSDMRRQAKTVNFGILYGISAFGLSERSEMSRGEASELIKSYFDQYPALKSWQDSTIEFAKSHEYVETVTGRRRYLKDINSRNASIRGGAERVAINAPIQGSAADMIKIAMVRIFEEFQRNQWKSRMLLQVHDELVFDLHTDEVEVVPPVVCEMMENAIPLDSPIVVEHGIGSNWLDAH